MENLHLLLSFAVNLKLLLKSLVKKKLMGDFLLNGSS